MDTNGVVDGRWAELYLRAWLTVSRCFIGNNLRVIILDPGVDVFNKMPDAFVLQSHGIQHSAGCFGHPGVGVAVTVF